LVVVVVVVVVVVIVVVVKSKVIPVIIEATGTISKSLRQYLSNIQEEHEIKEPQKQPYRALRT